MYKIIIHDAIRSVINKEFVEKVIANARCKYVDTIDGDRILRRNILQSIDYLTDDIYNTRSTSMLDIASNISSNAFDKSVCKLSAKKIIIALKQSEYWQYCKVYEKNDQFKYIINIDWGVNGYSNADMVPNIINFGKYSMSVEDIMKHQNRWYNNLVSRKYSMLSDSLYHKLMNIIERKHIDQSCEHKRHDTAADMRRLSAATRTIKNTNFDSNTTRNFTINKKGEMTYIPKGRKTILVENDEQGIVWQTDNRQEMKYGKAIRQIYCREYLPGASDTFIQDASQQLKSLYTFSGALRVVKGADIQEYYHHSKYNSGVNTESLGNSCMRHSSCEDFFGLYVNNPDVVQMVIGETDDGIIGRALLWTTDNGAKIMDRIYGNEVTINAFKTWAHENGYMHKRVQGYTYDKEFISPIGEMVTNRYQITLKNETEEYPYMDTFKYTEDIGSSTMTLSNCDTDEEYILDSTEGGPGNLTLCECGNRYHEDDVTYLEYGNYEGYYHNDYVGWCDWSNDSYHRDDMVSTTCGQWVYRGADDLIYCDIVDKYAHHDDVVYSETEQSYLLECESVECCVVGWIRSSDSKELEYENTKYLVHEDVSELGLQEHLTE